MVTFSSNHSRRIEKGPVLRKGRGSCVLVQHACIGLRIYGSSTIRKSISAILSRLHYIVFGSPDVTPIAFLEFLSYISIITELPSTCIAFAQHLPRFHFFLHFIPDDGSGSCISFMFASGHLACHDTESGSYIPFLVGNGCCPFIHPRVDATIHKADLAVSIPPKCTTRIRMQLREMDEGQGG